MLHLLFCIVVVKFYMDNSFIRGFLGDVFFMGLLYHFLKGFYDFNKNNLMIFLLLLAFGFEFCQYFKILGYFRLDNKVLKFIFGATFDFWDLLAYSFGIILVYVEEKWEKL